MVEVDRASRCREAMPGEDEERLLVVRECDRLFRLRLVEDLVEQVPVLRVEVVVEQATVALQPRQARTRSSSSRQSLNLHSGSRPSCWRSPQATSPTCQG